MIQKDNKINYKKVLHNPWLVGSAFFFLGLLIPKTISSIKQFSLINNTTTNIKNVGNMYIGANNSDKGLAVLIYVFLVILLMIFIFFILRWWDKE